MAFSPEQIAMLAAKLDPKHVKQLEHSKASYVEGWHCIAEANRIFGFDGWNSQVELRECGQPTLGKDKWDNDQWAVSYMAKSTITVGGIIREGIGYGSGYAKQLGDAYEGAIKEAETDAIKRALRTFGNPFGLALYDKKKSNVGAPEPQSPAAPNRQVMSGPLKTKTALKKAILDMQNLAAECNHVDELDGIWNSHTAVWQQCQRDLPDDFNSLNEDDIGLAEYFNRRKNEIELQGMDSDPPI